ncbi:hypothetical protein FJY94_01545 [Candidatus Kaiserbacteria bacterium]|nr:hypothetical protein [Candidatus Kaiserbacteria bacterium]
MEHLNFSQKRRALEQMKKKAANQATVDVDARTGKTRWGLYRENPAEYFESADEAWEGRIKEYFDELHRHGEQVVYVDICGTADGALIGADKTYAFALRIPDAVENRVDRILVEGDLFSRKDFLGFLQTIREASDTPALITFEPFAGIESHTVLVTYTENPDQNERESKRGRVAYARLEQNLISAIDAVRPGGYILIGETGAHWTLDKRLGQDTPITLPTVVEAIANKHGCTFEWGGIGRFLLRKTEQ